MSSKWYEEKDKLEKFIFKDKLSYEEIGRIYGCSGVNIKKVSLRIGIELPQKRRINNRETFNVGQIRVPIKKCLNCGKEFKHYSGHSGKYCCNECVNEYKHKQHYLKIVNGDSSIMRANYSPSIFRKDILNEQGGVCAICNLKCVWNGKPLVMIVDHIDGDASNNKRDNLRCICPNCDSQLDTYKSKNKNGARSYYRYHKQIE